MQNIDLKPMLSKLNHYCTSTLEGAAGLCLSRGSYEITIEHFLLKALEETTADIQHILRSNDIDASRLLKALQYSVEKEKTGNSRKPVFSSLLIELIQDAWMIASVEFGLSEIRSGMLFLAMLGNARRYVGDEYYRELESLHFDKVKSGFADMVGGSGEQDVYMEKATGGNRSATAGAAGPAGDSALARFAINFTDKARQGEIDPVFCRDIEIRQMVDILGRRRKNNPILVGEPGVGKTAVIEGLALKIVEGDVPDILRDTNIYGLDMGLLQAGASVKGEFEQRLKSVINEIKSATEPTILFIDEAHTLIGAGGPAGGGDAANLLKPALARGEMRTIAATTWSEYKKYFEKDPALARRFQLVKIEEPSIDQAVTIMRGLREKYEQAHSVYIRDDSIVASAQLAARYISGRQLPDKSVDLLDTASARVKLSISAKPDQIDDLERRIKTLERQLHAQSRDIDTGVAAAFDDISEVEREIEQTRERLQQLSQKWQAEKEVVERIITLRRRVTEEKDNDAKQELQATEESLKDLQAGDPLIHYEVSPDAISKVVSDWTGVPVGSMVKDEAKIVLTFKENLNKRIKGQDYAMDSIDRRIRGAKAGLGSPHTPIGVMLFVGPSGVGKTETALSIADLLFGGERFVISINMSEFQEKHTVSRLIGSPPGYVGYGEGGLLTEAVRQRPYSVVLLDEVEKADPEVMNLFYQVFDKGTLTDGEGREVDFKNTIIILTSNLATDIITGLGMDATVPMDTIMEAVRPVLNNHFKPALLARMEVVPYLPLNHDALGDIVRLKLNQLGDRLHKAQRIALNYGDDVVQQITQRCKEVETGARNIDYIVNKNLLPNISSELLQMMADGREAKRLELSIDTSGGFAYQFI